MRQVVAGGRFLGARAGRDDLAVAAHDFQRQHVVAHGAVAHRVGAGGAGRGHAAERGVGAGIDREEQALVAQMLVERLAGDAGLDHAVEILGVHREHLVHVAQVDRDAAGGRVDLALERGAGAEGDDGHAVSWRRSAPRPGCRRSPAPSPRASGGWLTIQVVVWPCCSRTACEVIEAVAEPRGKLLRARSPGLAARAASDYLVMVVRHGHSSRQKNRGKGHLSRSSQATATHSRDGR